MDYRKLYEEAEAEMLQTQKINRQYGTRSGTTKSNGTGTNQNSGTKKTGGNGTSSNTTKNTTKKEQDSGGGRSGSKNEQDTLHKNGTLWYNISQKSRFAVFLCACGTCAV